MNIDNSKEGHCDYNDFKRARYFDGEILNKQIFVAEQSYHHEKRKLLNKMLHGWGVVCGLKVKSTNPPSSNIIVEPGLALDCHGNEILICEEQTVDLSAKTCIQRTQKNPCLDDAEETEDTALYVVIRYKEIASDPVLSYAPSGSCEEKSCDYSRTREGFCIEVWDKLPPTPKQRSINLLCSEPFACPTCCPEPHYIVLATISCGERIDRVFSECELIDQIDKINQTLKDKDGKPIKIRCQIRRRLPSVCISDKDKTTDFEDSYSFETDQDFDYEGSTWEINAADLDEHIDAKMDVSEGPISKISNYSFNPKGTKGSYYMEIPVTLNFLRSGSKDQPLYIFAYCSMSLRSPIYIGRTEAKYGSIISNAMIRNMENRQTVITFPLLSWLLRSSGIKELQLSPCNLVGVFSELISIAISREREKVQPVVSIESFEEVKGKLVALEENISTLPTKIENSVNKDLYNLRKKVGDVDKKIVEIEKKLPSQ